jgi:hypothetical protein
MGRAAPLHADLHYPLVLACRGQHGLRLDHIDADRLLHPHVHAGLHCLDHGQRVPVVRRVDQDDVEVALLEHLAVVAVQPRDLLRDLARGDQLARFGEHPAVHVAQRHHVDRRDLHQPEQVGLAVPAGANQPDPLAGARQLLRVRGKAGRGNRAGAVLQKLATMHVNLS